MGADRRLASEVGVGAVISLTGPKPARLVLNLDTGCMRIAIRVRPGSAHPGVGGEHGGALVVRVSARAVDGKATEEVLSSSTIARAGRRRCSVRARERSCNDIRCAIDAAWATASAPSMWCPSPAEPQRSS